MRFAPGIGKWGFTGKKPRVIQKGQGGRSLPGETENKHLTQRRTTEKKKSYKIKNLHLTRPVPWYPGWADVKRGKDARQKGERA